AWGGCWPPELDVGGGWPSRGDPPARRGRFRDRPVPPPAAAYAGTLARTLSDSLAKLGISALAIVLEGEPGRALYADAGIHLARITSVKTDADRTWVETDTSEFFLFDTLAEQAFFVPVPVEQPDRLPTV